MVDRPRRLPRTGWSAAPRSGPAPPGGRRWPAAPAATSRRPRPAATPAPVRTARDGRAAAATSRTATGRRTAPAPRRRRSRRSTRVPAASSCSISAQYTHRPDASKCRRAPATSSASAPGHQRHRHHLGVRMRQPRPGLHALVLEDQRGPQPRVTLQVGDPVAPGGEHQREVLDRQRRPGRVVPRRLDDDLVRAEPVHALERGHRRDGRAWPRPAAPARGWGPPAAASRARPTACRRAPRRSRGRPRLPRPRTTGNRPRRSG